VFVSLCNAKYRCVLCVFSCYCYFIEFNADTQLCPITEVKQKLYTHSMGSWTRYKDQLQPMIAELQKYLPKLKRSKSLPFIKDMNWNLDPNFDYSVEREIKEK
jgi:hypothetical protein